MVHHWNWIIPAAVIFTLTAFLPSAQAEPPLIEENPGLPGCLAKVDQLEQIIAELLDAMQHYAPVPQTGQTVSRTAGDDGDFRKGITWPVPRFTDNGNGTVTDNLTRLIWLKNANCFGQKTWTDALTESNNLKHGCCGLTDGSNSGDWRLPNVKELQSLINYGVHDPALPDTSGTGKWAEGDPFTGVLCDVTNCAHGYYWSSTTVEGSGDAYYVYLGGGFVEETSKTHHGYYVWPVRGGN
jgi:hypothetical protein